MPFAKDLLAELEERETEFVEELHRITYDPHKVLLVGNKNAPFAGGWIVLLADEGSGDWNMARMIGDPASAISLVHLLPKIELQLLVPEGFKHLLPECFKFSGSIEYFSSESSVQGECVFTLPAHSLTVNEKLEEAKGCFATYLLLEESIVGYIKSTRFTRNFIEVYIEVAPAWRQKGLGRWLLQRAISLARSWNKKIMYAVDLDNQASLANARACGLQKFLRLNRYEKKR